MPLPVYATAEQYATWAGSEADSSVDVALLRRASRAIDELTIGCPYEADSDSLPVDPVKREALIEATCAQAHWAVETGDASGAAALLGGAAIGTVRLPTQIIAGAAQAAVSTRHAPEAIAILRAHGLMNRVVES